MHVYFDPRYIHIGKPLLFLLVVTYSAIIAGVFELVNRKNMQRMKEDSSSAELRFSGTVDALTAQNLQLVGSTQQLKLVNEQQNEIAVFLRDNYDTEISTGLHNTRTFSSVVIGYLKKEREYAKRRSE